MPQWFIFDGILERGNLCFYVFAAILAVGEQGTVDEQGAVGRQGGWMYKPLNLQYGK